MKRALILAALAAMLATPALAFNPAGSATPRVLPVRAFPSFTKPLAQRVLVVFDGRDDALLTANVKADAAATTKILGPTLDAWRLAGAQVDVVRTDFFETPADSSIGDVSHKQGPAYLWQTLGSYYPTVVCVGFNADGASSRKRYFSADSTTAKIIHIGGWAGSTYVDSTTFGLCTATVSNSDYRRGSVVSPYNTNADTLWFSQIGYATRSASLLPGVSSVVRIFNPVKTATYFGIVSDSTAGVFPAGSDTVAAAGEIMPVAWRVYWTTSGRSVDYVIMAGSVSATTAYGYNMGHVLTALVSRTTQLAPAKAAMEWDDLFDTNPTNATRPANASIDSVYAEFRYTYGIPLAISTNPRHAAEYFAGSNPTRESAWTTGGGWTWIRRGIPWVHHAHDSTGSDIASGLVGRFGGYSTQNGSSDSAGTATTNVRYVYRHRYGIAPVNGDAYTIKYRLQWADSVRNAVCPTCFTPPYLSFPNNEMLPIDWRVSTGQSVASAVRSGFVTRWKSYQGDGKMPVDSVLSAFAAGLRIPDGGTLYLRTGVANNGTGAASVYRAHGAMPPGYTGGPPGDDSPHNWVVSGDGDSVIAKTPFAYPGERTASRIDGRLIRVRNITPTTYDGVSRDNYRNNVQRTLSALLGCRTGTLTGGGFSTWAESYAADPGGMFSANAPQRNFGVQNSRMVYLHPSAIASGWSFATGPSSSYAIDVARLGLLGGLRTLNSVAGHSLIRWVYPWEVYSK